MRIWFHTLWRAILFEVRGIPRRPWEWVTALLLPLFWFWFVANSFGTGLMRDIPVGLVNLDGTKNSLEVVQRLDALPSIAWVGYDDRMSAEKALSEGTTYGTLVIPRNFTRDAMKGEGGTLELQINKTYYAIGTTIESDVKQALAAAKVEHGAALKTMMTGGSIAENARFLRVSLPDLHLLGNPSLNFNPYLLATLIPGLIVLAFALTMEGVLVRDWRDRGMVRGMEVAGGSTLIFILARVIPWSTIYSLISMGWVAWFAGLEGYAPAGSLFVWFAGSVLLVWATAAICVLFLSLSISWVLGLSTAIAVFAPSFPFTGFSYPFSAMSPGAHYFGEFLPLTHYMELQGGCWVLGSPLSHLTPLLGILGLFIVIPFTIGALILTKRIPAWRDAEALAAGERKEDKNEKNNEKENDMKKEAADE